MPRKKSGLKTLPPELLIIIMEHLALQDDYRSLFNLARSSRFLTPMAIPLAKSAFFKRIKIHLPYPSEYTIFKDELVEVALKHINSRLTRERAFCFVRELILSNNFFGWGRKSWDLIVHFIKKLPALTDFHWVDHCGVPIWILDSLFQCLPNCRFHLEREILRSLKDGRVDPFDLKVISFPRLYRATVHYHTAGTSLRNGTLGVIGRIPSLRELDIFWCDRYPRSLENPLVELPKIFNEDAPRTLASIESIRILIRHPDWVGEFITRELVVILDNVTALPRIKYFQIDYPFSEGALEFLSTGSHFQDLETLSMTLDNSSMPERDNSYYTLVSRFLEALPPLSELTLREWHPSVAIPPFAKHHGQALRRLALFIDKAQHPTGKNSILALATHCPLLEHVALTLQRRQGDIEEVETYKALGAIRKLTSVNLAFRIGDMPTASPDLSNESQKESKRKEYINSAIDEELATSIFHTISSGKSTGSHLLERLEIQGTQGGVYAPHWLVKRDARYRYRNRIAAMVVDADDDARNKRVRNLEPLEEEVFCTIWPQPRPQRRKVTKKLKNKREKEKESTVVWFHWSSYPLASDSRREC